MKIDSSHKNLNEIKKRHELKITAVIPCRKGSTRCKNKNIRKWGNTNLLQNKIDILKGCEYIDEIVVNTNDDKAIKIAKENKISYVKRSEDLCIGNVAPAKVHLNLAKNIKNEIFLYSSPVSPFISSKTIDKIIHFWRNNPAHEIVCASNTIKHFIWEDNKPYNFQINNGIVGTQELEDKYKFACPDGCLIGYKNEIIKNQCLFGDGKKIYMYEINELESIDIDWNLNFVISESLFHRSFKNIELVEGYMKNDKFQKTNILDCTIRDSGYLNDWNWSYETVKDFLYFMGEIGISYCEIGFLFEDEFNNKKLNIWRNINDNFSIVKKLKDETKTKTKISVLLNTPHIKDINEKISKIPTQQETKIDLIRVACYFDNLEETKELIYILNQKGYELTLNVMHASHINRDEIKKIKRFVRDLPIEYLYFADSLGSITPNEINQFMMDLKNLYPIKNGFHNHNNNGTVFGNLINLLNCNIDMLDGTIGSFGKNGGNANLEQLIIFLCLKENYNLNIKPLLVFLEKIKNVDFGGEKINISTIKNMLGQFMNIHSSHIELKTNEKLIDFYNRLKNLENKKKIF